MNLLTMFDSIGYECASSHLRDIRRAKYGAHSPEANPPGGVSTNTHSDFAEFYCGAILSDNTTGVSAPQRAHRSRTV